MIIRQAIASDEPAIRACAELAFSPYVEAIGRKPVPMTADFGAEIAAGWTRVATNDDGRIQAYVVYFPQDGFMLLETVAVDPAAAGKGVGKALIGLCESEARRLGLAGVRLYTNAKMTRNLSIYPHLGYAEVDRRGEGGFSRVFFEKRFD